AEPVEWVSFRILVMRPPDGERFITYGDASGFHFAIGITQSETAIVFVPFAVFRIQHQAPGTSGINICQNGSVEVITDWKIPAHISQSEAPCIRKFIIPGKDQPGSLSLFQRKKPKWKPKRGRDTTDFEVGWADDGQFVWNDLLFCAADTEMR